ncbi:MAG: hypothetical protein ACLT1Q_08155 [Anaerobutyricum soehngenii]
MSIKTNLGTVTAYADAKAHGYTGTKEEFGEVLANFAESATQVADDKKTVEAIKTEITKIQSDVTQKHEEVKENANKAANAASSAGSAASSASSSQQAAKQSEQNINNIVSTFDSHVESKTTEIDTAANAAKQKAVSAVEAQANASVQKVENSTSSYITDQKVTAEKEINNYTSSKITEIDTAANAAKKSLNETITNANTAKSALDASVKTSDTSKTDLDKSIQSSSVKKTELDGSITKANQAKTDLDNSTSTSNNVLQSLQSENSSAASNIEELKSENFNSQEILSGVADLRAYLGLTADDIVGLQVDYKNKTFKRLAGAANLTPGSDFDKFSMYGGRRKCNVADDGTINAWYGDDNYTEDGSNGQVMVYQPKFYYLVCPVEYDPIDTGIGYHLRKANYYVCEKPRAGFRLHPAFYDASGKEIDYYLTATYEGSLYDTSAAAYLLQDEQVMSSAEDKFSSIAGARPASGSSQNLTRTEIEKMAQNRGTNWHGDLIKPVSAEQLLMIIELGIMNTQTGVGQGVVGLPYTTGDDTTSSYAAATGSTTALGNGTGRAEKTTTYEGGSAKEYTVDGKTSICWRGKENFWGNIWKFVYGISIWGNGKMNGGQPYICSDFNFAENKNSGNYEPAGFTVAPKEGYISAMGYSTKFDWLFIASETLGNSSLPVGDYTYLTQNLNGYRIALLGGHWAYWSGAGAFDWNLSNGVGVRGRGIGGRLVYIPDRDSDAYTTAIASWKSQITA